MVIDKICGFPSDKHSLYHWKFVLSCCTKCPSIVTHNQELHITTQIMCTAIRFHVYKVFSRCTLHGRHIYE